MSKLIFVNRYAPPDHSATAQILGDLVFHLASLGRDVHVVTGDQRYDDPKARLPESETIGRVTFWRVRGSRFGRGKLLLRALDYLSFLVRAYSVLGRVTEPGDVVVAKTDPPLLSILVALVAIRRRAKLVNWLQDIFPEIAVRLGIRGLKGPLGLIARLGRDWSLRQAARTVVISDRMRSYVISRGVGPSRVALIGNWNVDDDALVRIPVGESRMRTEWDLQDHVVVCYSGNLGRAHDYVTILSAARQFRDDRRIKFLFIGSGHGMQALKEQVRQDGLEDVFQFRGYQSRGNLAQSLAVADVHLLSLLPELEGLIFPSKLYGIAAAGRPMIAIAAPDGEIADMLTRFECGAAVAPGDGDGLARSIRAYRDDPVLRDRLGANARSMWESDFKRAGRLASWVGLLDAVGAA